MKYSEHVFVGLGIQHVMYAKLSSVTCPAIQNFFLNYLKNSMIFEGVIEHKMCVLIFSTSFVWSTFHAKKN